MKFIIVPILFSHYREPDIDSNESEFSSFNLEQKYYGDSQNEMSNIEGNFFFSLLVKNFIRSKFFLAIHKS